MAKAGKQGILLLKKMKDGVERLELIYQSVIQDGAPPFDPKENPELHRLWQEFRRGIELGNETRTIVALRQMLEIIVVNILPQEPDGQQS